MYIERSRLKINSDLKTAARAQLTGKWGTAILVCILSFVILGVSSFVSYFIAGALYLGLSIFFIKLVRDENPSIENLFDGFKRFVSSLAMYLVMTIFILLWSLLLFIPGIIATLRYSQAYYILNDNSEMGAMEAIEKSKELMKGQKGKLFLLQLSFIGWFFLSILTLGIGLLWLVPYYQTTMANFYEDIKKAQAAENF